jgi:hypothetical protein
VQKLDLKEGIAGFYDESSAMWETMWGEHMHHGTVCGTRMRDPLTVQRTLAIYPCPRSSFCVLYADNRLVFCTWSASFAVHLEKPLCPFS